ncbi:MAG: 4-hydroxythreonine-4-phosphate dehydrogenase PdxA [Saprospiraceae bacterium]|jgi:4-hydroxythreonine-4-phosphate dehydrogenase
MAKDLKIGISIGDFNGIGLEVVLKTLAHPLVLEMCTPVIYGSSKVVSYHKNIVDRDDLTFTGIRSADQIETGRINVVNCWQESVNITLGKMTNTSGKYAALSLDAAVHDLKSGLIDGLVTAPINKHAMALSEFEFAGHTEFITEVAEVETSLMLMVHDILKVGLVSNHLPLREVSDVITKDLILEKIKVLHETLKVDFSIERPTIAVLGLNPHAGDGGTLGDEDDQLIRPAIIEAKKTGALVNGPFAADGFFGSGQYRKYDAILAMYHDQGLIPFKTLTFGGGVNYTAGLPFVRTSPDHGTAYELAGRNEADPTSFMKALFLAVDIIKTRRQYVEMHDNPILHKIELAPDEDQAN